MSFIFLPRLKMITDRKEIKPGLISGDSERDLFRHLELLVRQLEANLKTCIEWRWKDGKIPSKRASAARAVTDFNQCRRSKESAVQRFEFCRETFMVAAFERIVR